MSEDASGPLSPTENHQRLLEKVGDWKVACKYFMNPAEDPIEATGTDHVEAIGEYWTTGLFDCEVMGNPIRGLATTGFDPTKNKFVGTWQDSSNPFFYYFEGELDAEGVLTMTGENADPMSGAIVMYRSVEKLAKDERTLELYIEYSKDKIIKILEYEYTRA